MSDLRIATRLSSLALAQARRVAQLIADKHPDLKIELVEVPTAGDRDQHSSVTELTEVGAFVRAVQDAVIEGRADLAVHSLKDLPVLGPDELVLAALPERISPYDVLVGSTLDGLPSGAIVGTGSPRRASQLELLRPDLQAVELRGNVDTRVEKVKRGEVAAAILAEAGLARLGRTELMSQRFATAEMVPAPGQGALAIEARERSHAGDLAQRIDDPSLRTLLTAERLLLAETGAGCRSALGALATWEGDVIRMEAFVSDDRGPRRTQAFGETPEAVVAEARKGLKL